VLFRSDLLAPDTTDDEVLLGTHELSAGEHKLVFRCVSGRNDKCYLGVEALQLLALPPEAVREVKGENERGFIRIGIGSAVYCFTLANGRVPESLQELVDMGIMEPRFLKDENMHPLKSRRDGDRFVVESTGPEAWTFSWSGADARR